MGSENTAQCKCAGSKNGNTVISLQKAWWCAEENKGRLFF